MFADHEPKVFEPKVIESKVIEPKVTAPDLSVLTRAKTLLYQPPDGPFYTYKNIPWKLRVRKEVYSCAYSYSLRHYVIILTNLLFELCIFL